MSKIIINLKKIGDSRFKNWAKTLTAVDTTQQNGYCFVGEFIQMGRKHELEVGTLILRYTESGNTKYHTPCIELMKVTTEGLNTFYKKECPTLQGWALEVRDEIAKFLPESTPQTNLLEKFSDAEILAEMHRRRLTG